jgi:hypothetical protein
VACAKLVNARFWLSCDSHERAIAAVLPAPDAPPHRVVWCIPVTSRHFCAPQILSKQSPVRRPLQAGSVGQYGAPGMCSRSVQARRGHAARHVAVLKRSNRMAGLSQSGSAICHIVQTLDCAASIILLNAPTILLNLCRYLDVVPVFGSPRGSRVGCDVIRCLGCGTFLAGYLRGAWPRLSRSCCWPARPPGPIARPGLPTT